MQQRVGRHALAQDHGHLDLFLHQLIALELDLPAADIERGQDLIVGRCGRMGHIGFVERRLAAGGEILVVDVDHGALTQGRQRLVGGLRAVDAQARRIRIGQQARHQPGLLVGGSKGLLEGLVALAIGRPGEALTQAFGRGHGGALAIAGHEMGKGEPGLVP